MRILAAFDKFKDSMSAPRACAVAAGAFAGMPGAWEVDCCPLADGGEGFSGILTESGGGREIRLEVTGPRGGRVAAGFGLVPVRGVPEAARSRLGVRGTGGHVGVVEMASASGLALLAPGQRDALSASSVGTGQLLLAAADAGARVLLLGVGGSATHDLGLGALEAFGARFEDASGESLRPIIPAKWHLLAGIAGAVAASLPPILIACDVDNPLLGPRGAAQVYGPQKGLRPADAAALERETARIAALLCRHFGRAEDLAARPGAGAAGGITLGLMAAAGAALLPGFDLVASWLDLDARMAGADIIVTGEGRFDETSLSGKGPGAVVRRGLSLGKTVHVFAGQVALAEAIPGLHTHAITPEGMPLDEALARAPALLADAVRRAVAAR